MAEKIFSRHAGRTVRAGEIILADIDVTMSHDANRPLAIEAFEEMGGGRIFDPKRIFMMLDHHFPAPGQGSALAHQKLRQFCKTQGCQLYEGEGVAHVVLPEKGHVLPGDLVIGTDSHTCTYGALGALSTGVGSTDMAVALMTGKLWFLVPETIRMNIGGKLPPGVFPKDLILHIIGTITADGATYQAVEFAGPVIEKMSMDGRFTLSNMAVEMGAKAGLIAPDQITLDWVKGRARREFNPERPDPDASYAKILEFDATSLPPYIAKPHYVDNVVPIGEVVGTPVQQANLVSCTGARMEDFRIAASILRGRRLAPGMRMMVVPSSREVLKMALQEGLINIFVDAGCSVGAPNCGGCGGDTFGTPSDGDAVISTANRNFKGRLGNPNSFIYLASPATVVASAIAGRIADPRPYFQGQ
jgi:3-isopropylmalate/(R)-2-methylmalate dehydratase large subunit